MREEKSEKDIIDKCKTEPKLFYGFINRKIKLKGKIVKIKDREQIFDDPKDMTKVLNKRFQAVFT